MGGAFPGLRDCYQACPRFLRTPEGSSRAPDVPRTKFKYVDERRPERTEELRSACGVRRRPKAARPHHRARAPQMPTTQALPR
eukprot:scaffold3226_cov251-Pinguiococcus_pyrenoidosus.AAC.7